MNKKTFNWILKLTVAIAAIVWCVVNIGLIFNVIGKILGILSPFLYGCCVAFVINVLLRPVERGWEKAFRHKNETVAIRFKRPASIVICLLIVTGLMATILLLVGPGLAKSVIGLIENIPAYVDTVQGWWEKLIVFASGYGIQLPDMTVNPSDVADRVLDYLNTSGNVFLDNTIVTASSVVSFFVTAILSIIFAIYILAQKEKLGSSAKRVICTLTSETVSAKILKIAGITDKTFSSFVSGQCIEACAFGLMSFIGMMIFHFPYAGLIAVVLGFTTLIPVFGAFIGLGIGFFLILLVDPIKALWFIVFVLLLQQFDNNVVYPRIVGKSVGLPGMLVLLAVTVGGSGFGILGMLTSVPVCAVLYGLFKEYIDVRAAKKKVELSETQK